MLGLGPLARAAVLLVISAVVVAGCGGADNGDDGKQRVVATTTQVADLVRNVGADRVEVDRILRPNADPHDYEPRPSDARAVAKSDLVVRSGGDLDDWLDGVIDNAGGERPTLTLMEAMGSRAREDDPHWWQDPRNAEAAAAAIRDRLIETDPGGREIYERNVAEYLRKLERLDAEVARCIAELEPGERKLVTSHDALGHYADRYGIEVVGALIPSRSSQAQPSAGDTADLVDQIKAERVKAIFPESSLDPKLERSVARETGAEVGGELYADSLGPAGTAGETYLGSIAANTATIVEGLSGGRVRCRPRS